MITGNENAFPKTFSGYEGHQGLTIRQLALKDFMCALVQHGDYDVAGSESIAEAAQSLTSAYIDQLNKNEQ